MNETLLYKTFILYVQQPLPEKALIMMKKAYVDPSGGTFVKFEYDGMFKYDCYVMYDNSSFISSFLILFKSNI